MLIQVIDELEKIDGLSLMRDKEGCLVAHMGNTELQNSSRIRDFGVSRRPMEKLSDQGLRKQSESFVNR